MKHLFLALICVAALLSACSGGGASSETQHKLDSLTNVAANQEARIKQLRDTVEMLQFPADQRLAKIKELIASENFSEAKSSIEKLQSLFPNSEEAKSCPALRSQIDSRLTEIEAEKERIKALGFKALKPESKVTVGYNNVTFSSISTGNKFIHDVYPTYGGGSEWREHTADRGNKYITAAMDVNSTSKNPDIPTPAFYSVHGSTLKLEGTFRINMARWSDYGTYLGNEPDLKNDFSKVSTVKFKVGLELPESGFSKPYVVVLKKENSQVRNEDRMSNPPIYYYGEANYPQTLTLNDFTDGNYVALKIANL